MNRRRFIKIFGGGIILATGFAKLAADSIKKVMSASHGTIRYPGKIKGLNDCEIKKQGKWLG